MNPSEYQAVFAAEETHWWYQGMQSITQQILRTFYLAQPALDILDAGCGTGGSMVYLSQFGQVAGCDYSPHALAFCQQRHLTQLSRAGVEQLPFASHSFDLVTSFDVLYHQEVTDYQQALNEFHRVLRPGGRVLLRLPAYNWLRGHHDTIIQTARRFTTRECAAALHSSQFQVEKLSYANTLLFPLALGKRLFDRLRPPATESSDVHPVPAWQNNLFHRCLQAEARWLGNGRTLPFGLTVIALGQKA